MACDFTPTGLRLAAAGTLIATSAGLVAGAAIANGSFFGAAASPGLMVGAGVAATLAGVALGESIGAVNGYRACLARSGRQCDGEAGNVVRSLEAMRVVMGINATACFGTAAAAWIPWAAQPAMWVILGSLIAQGMLVPGIIGFSVALVRCAERAPAPIPEPSPIN